MGSGVDREWVFPGVGREWGLLWIESEGLSGWIESASGGYKDVGGKCAVFLLQLIRVSWG